MRGPVARSEPGIGKLSAFLSVPVVLSLRYSLRARSFGTPAAIFRRLRRRIIGSPKIS